MTTRTMLHRVALAVFIAFVARSAGPATASSISPLIDAPDPRCADLIGPNPLLSGRVVADLRDDAAASGIAGAEFRLTGLDAGPFFVTITPNPAANVFVGNPTTGVTIGFPSCQTASPVLLFSFSVAFYDGRPLTIHVDGGPIAGSCPRVSRCDAPDFTQLCVTGGTACVNNPTCCATVGMERATWSGIKRMYD